MDDRVQKVADLIFLSVRKAPRAHVVSERRGNASNVLCQPQLPSHCLFLRGRKGFVKQRTISLVRALVQRVRSDQLSGHQDSNSANTQSCVQSLMSNLAEPSDRMAN